MLRAILSIDKYPPPWSLNLVTVLHRGGKEFAVSQKQYAFLSAKSQSPPLRSREWTLTAGKRTRI